MTAIVTRPIGSSASFGNNQTNVDFSAPRTQGEQIKGAGYRTLAGNLKQFADLSCMPKGRSLSRLDEGDGIAAAFFKHRARYEKSCYALFTSTKLKRAQKRKSEAHNEPLAEMLLPKLGGEDLIALEASYYGSCLSVQGCSMQKEKLFLKMKSHIV